MSESDPHDEIIDAAWYNNTDDYPPAARSQVDPLGVFLIILVVGWALIIGGLWWLW